MNCHMLTYLRNWEWQKNGLGIPCAVIDATEEYREEEDEIGEFIAEMCVSEGQIERNALHTAYRSWAESRGIKLPMRPKGLAKRLRVRPGISEVKSNGHRYWKGITLSADTVAHFRAVA